MPPSVKFKLAMPILLVVLLSLFTVQHRRLHQLQIRNRELNADLAQNSSVLSTIHEQLERWDHSSPEQQLQKEFQDLQTQAELLRPIEEEMVRVRQQVLTEQNRKKELITQHFESEQFWAWFEESRIAIQQLSLHLRLLKAKNNLGTAFDSDGKLRLNSIKARYPEFPIDKFHLMVTNSEQLRVIMDQSPRSIVAVSDPAPSWKPGKKYIRYYMLADGQTGYGSTTSKSDFGLPDDLKLQ